MKAAESGRMLTDELFFGTGELTTNETLGIKTQENAAICKSEIFNSDN